MDQQQNFPSLNDLYCSNPPLVIKQSPEGYILNELALPQPENANWLTGIIAFIVITGFLIVFSWFFLILLIILGFVLVFNTKIRNHFWWETVCFEPGDLIFSHYPLTLDDSDRLLFRCRLRDNFITRLFKVKEIPTPSRIEIKLICLERVSYTKGTDTITENAVIESQLLHRQNIYSGSQEIVSNFDLSIPGYLPPSFEANHNQIRWILLVEKYIPDLAEPVCSKFTLQVNRPL
jgi:hypothetical protein